MTDNYCIALQPICDREMNHIADELLYRSSTLMNRVNVADDMLATARVTNIAFYEFGIEHLVGKRKLFVNVSRDWILNPSLLPPNSTQVVLEVLEGVEAEPEVLEALRRIRKKGYEIALDDFVLTPANRRLVDVANIVKIDKWQTISSEDILFYKKKGVRLLAEKVEEVEDFKRLRRLGFDYFQGYFYAKPEMHRGTNRIRSSNQKAQIEILKELQEEYADFNKLEMLIKQDPHLTFLVLRQTNSVFYSRVNKSYSIVEAINTLGLKQIKTIVLTVMLANNRAASRLVLPQILTRAFMCEQLALQYQVDPDLAFTLGLLSQMDQLLGIPLEQLLCEVGLDETSVHNIIARTGAVGRLLKIVECFENAKTCMDEDGHSVKSFNQVWLRSRVWAESILQATLIQS